MKQPVTIEKLERFTKRLNKLAKTWEDVRQPLTYYYLYDGTHVIFYECVDTFCQVLVYQPEHLPGVDEFADDVHKEDVYYRLGCDCILSQGKLWKVKSSTYWKHLEYRISAAC